MAFGSMNRRQEQDTSGNKGTEKQVLPRQEVRCSIFLE